ncbi:MAG TPA: DUF2961 domain-containing protein [Bryobacteraceae bacterium]|nr:DUF2961 domain-containing protein [Bryobacteraceae bacterium]
MLLLAGIARPADRPRPIPVGIDAYRSWDRWADQRIGMRAYMRSTYDRRGGNEGADASHFLYQLSDNFNVTLDLEGPGVLVFSRYNHWHGSPWHYVVDGTDHIVQETSSRDPLNPAPDSIFLPSGPFPSPLNWTWAITKGADLVWTPIPFEYSFQMAYSRTHYGTGYYIYDRFVPGTPLSRPVRSWSGKNAPAQDVLDLIAKSGTDIAPKAGCKSASGTLSLPPRAATAVAQLKGKATIRALEFSIPRNEAQLFENIHLRITWDGRGQPSVDAPIALFYGAGTLYNRDNREYLVKAFPVSIRFTDSRVYLDCYFPMPFFKSARIELVGGDHAIQGIEWRVRYMPLHEPASQTSYFHATYKDFPQPTPGEDLVLLDTRKAEGGGDWSGHLAGTSFIFSHDANLRTLEGDPRFFFDDSLTPQAQGTGTEEWGGGGDYWGGLNMTLPFVGHPVGARSTQSALNSEDKIESAYRFLLADLMPFGKNAVIRLEHGGMDESTEHYETVTYWYGLPAASLVETDVLQIGDAASEKKHGYSSPQASTPYTLKSRYEWGIDTLDGKEIYPAETDRGRTTTGTAEFQLRLRPDNLGVLLRRKLDYSFPNQRAEVYIADRSKANWKLAGIWYLAGSNTSVYSNPKGELGTTQHIVETSNRRFRDDEFLISRELTRGRKTIWVRVKFTPVNRPLYPGYPLSEQAWSEMRYTVYCFVMPKN